MRYRPFVSLQQLAVLIVMVFGLNIVPAQGSATRHEGQASAGGGQLRLPEPIRSRAGEIAPLLVKEPAQLFGPPLEDRAAWQDFARRNGPLLHRATRLAKKPPPELPDELYLLFFENGNRRLYETPYGERIKRLRDFAAAYAATLEAPYLEAMEREIKAILDEKTWVMPAHDRGRKNFDGKLIDVDLGSSRRGALLAAIHAMFAERLSPQLRERIEQNVEERVLAPFRIRLANPDSELCRWLTWTNNWNAVCLSQIVTAALALPIGVEEKAQIVAGAEQWLPRFLSGFTQDGYCSEGVGYWNYGFGHYVLLAETLHHATDGAINLFAKPIVRAVATYAENLEMAPGQFPAFSDTRRYPIPARWIRNITDVRLFGKVPVTVAEYAFWPNPLLPDNSFNLPPAGAGEATGSLKLPSASVGEATGSLKLPPAAMGGTGGTPTPDPLRGWFPDAQVLVARSGKESPQEHLSVALKGGHNGEHHNHNDLGQFVVSYRGRQPVIDSGGETYTARTFSARRYESDILNSYGHSVPVVAGQLQQVGEAARSRVLETRFSDTEDELLLDLSGAYAVPQLKQLERRFVYNRNDKGTLTVTDKVAFSSAQTFSTAIISCGTVEMLSPAAFVLRDGRSAVKVEVTAPQGQAFTISSAPIGNLQGNGPLRVQIAFDKPLRQAELVCVVSAAD